MGIPLSYDYNRTVASFHSTTVEKIGLNKNFTINDIIEYGNRSSGLGRAWTSFKLILTGKGDLNDEKFVKIYQFIQNSDAPQQIKSAIKANHVFNLSTPEEVINKKIARYLQEKSITKQESSLSNLFYSLSFVSAETREKENLYSPDVPDLQLSERMNNPRTSNLYCQEIGILIWNNHHPIELESGDKIKLWFDKTKGDVTAIEIYKTDDNGTPSHTLQLGDIENSNLILCPEYFEISKEGETFQVSCKPLNKGVECLPGDHEAIKTIASQVQDNLNTKPNTGLLH